MFPHLAGAGGVESQPPARCPFSDGRLASSTGGRSSWFMPSHFPAELKLDVPDYEEDISDLGPNSVPTSGWRTTINSSYSTTSTLSCPPNSDNDIYRFLVPGTQMNGIFEASST